MKARAVRPRVLLEVDEVARPMNLAESEDRAGSRAVGTRSRSASPGNLTLMDEAAGPGRNSQFYLRSVPQVRSNPGKWLKDRPVERLRFQPQQLRRIGLGHLHNVRLGDAMRDQSFVERQQSVGMKRIVGLTQVGGQDHGGRSDSADHFRVPAQQVLRKPAIDQLDIRAQLRGLLYL